MTLPCSREQLTIEVWFRAALYLIGFMCPGFRTDGLGPAVWRGGESEALDRLGKHLDKKVN